MKPVLDWSSYKDAGMGDAYADIPKHGGDYAKAIAVCINSGQCETDSKLVMCPSFKALEDKDLSTGGRVRLLKAALASDDWEDALKDIRLQKAMDLCLACKGCKRECDNNVDMAMIKSEYLAWRIKHEGVSWRSRLFAATPRWLGRKSGLATAIRWRNRSPLIRRWMEKSIGISASMPLPEPVSKKVLRQLRSQQQTQPIKPRDDSLERPEVVLFVDTFTRGFEPEIALAAETVLLTGGYSVQRLETKGKKLCCGRTYLAQGMIREARREVAHLMAALLPHVAAGRVIVGLEASCVLGLRDDALKLGLGEPLENISKQVFLLEEFLTKEIMAKRLKLPFKSCAGKETLIHGHCHQKAVGALKAVRKVMKLIPDNNFKFIDSGCCGMAGTFGLEAEHQQLGSQLANRELIPAINEAPGARVVANGFSCRQQIRAHSDRQPEHLAILLRDALDT